MRILGGLFAEHKNFFEGQNLEGEGLDHASSLEAAAILQRSISDAKPMDTPLYRGVMARGRLRELGEGLGWERVEREVPKPGDEFDLLGTSSFSASREVAEGFASGEGRGLTHRRDLAKRADWLAIYKILPGAKGVNASPLSPWNQQEVITSGRFRVVEVNPYDTMVWTDYRYGGNNQVPGYEIVVEQIGVWDVDVDEFKGKPVKTSYQ